MKKSSVMTLVAVSVVILLSGCDMGGGNPSSGPVTVTPYFDPDFENVLRAMGVDIDNPPECEVDVDNPLGSAVTIFEKDCEIFVSGVPLDSDSNDSTAYYLDGKGKDGSYSQLLSEANDSWTAHPSKSVAADVDGDGYDEIVSMYLDGNSVQLRELKYKSDSSSSSIENRGSPIAVETSESALKSGLAPYRQGLDSADIDGDGNDEIVFVNGLQVFTIDNDYSVMDSSLAMSSISSSGTPIVTIALDDFDMDGKAELVLVNGTSASGSVAELSIYTWDNGWNCTYNDYLLNRASEGMRCAGIGTGNLDDDNMPEIVFGGKQMGSAGTLRVYVMDVSYEDATVEYNMVDTCYTDGEEDQYCIDIAVGNVLGELESDNEIIGWDFILTFDGSDLDDYFDDDSNPLARSYSEGIFYPNGATANHGNYYGMLQLGDVNGDGLDNIVCTDRLKWELYIYYPDGHGDLSIYYIGTDEEKWSGYGSICLPDIDRDSNSFKYLGHELQFTKPQILTVITSPPYWSNRHQNLDQTSLVYSTSYSVDSSLSASFKISQSISLGAKAECPLLGSTAAEISTKGTFTRSLSIGINAGFTYEVSTSYSCAPGEDVIIMACVPVDVYFYEILSSCEEDEVGDCTAISVPREPILVSQSRSYYNTYNGGYTDIPLSALNNIEYGNPFSYPTSDDQTEIFENNLSELYKGVGLYTLKEDGLKLSQGASSNTLDVGLTLFAGAEAATSFSYSQESEATVAAVTMGIGGEYEFELALSVEYSKGMSLALSLGNITDENSYTTDIIYKAGVMAYPREWEDQEFLLATCWVDPLSN